MQTYTPCLLLLLSVLGSGSATPESTPPSTQPAASCPACSCCQKKGGWPTSLPADAQAVMDGFLKALLDGNRDRALSYCSQRTRSRASRYDAEEYLSLFVPTAKLQAEPKYRFWTYSGSQATGEYSYFGCFLRLSENPDGTSISWEWWLEKTAHGWQISLPDVPVERWVQEETDRHRRFKEKSEARWKALEPKLEGLRTELTGLESEHRVGQPMRFRLELINSGKHELYYDQQQVDVNCSMTITDQAGQRVAYLAGPVQTAEWSKPIKPGQTAVLFDSLDIAGQYDLSKPGKYRVQFSGRGLQVSDATSKAVARRSFPSNVVEIEVKP